MNNISDLTLFTISEVAEKYNMTRQNVLYLINNGDLKAEINNHGHYRLDMDVVNEFMKCRTYDKNKYYTIKELANRFDMSVTTVKNKIFKGEIKAIKFYGCNKTNGIYLIEKAKFKPPKIIKYIPTANNSITSEPKTIQLTGNEINLKDFYTLKQIKDVTGLSSTTIYRRFCKGLLTKYLYNNKVYVKKEEFSEYLISLGQY